MGRSNQMKQYTKWMAWAGLAVLLLALVAAWSPSAPAHAAARQRNATGGSLTLSITNGTSFQLDGYTGPHFSFVLQLSSAWQYMSKTDSVTITLDTGQTLGCSINLTSGVSQYTGGYNLNSAITTLPMGSHSATATYSDPTNSNQLLTSNTVNFTITPIYESLMCGIGSVPLSYSNGVWKPGQSVMMSMQSENSNASYPIDWTKGTATITLKGPKTVTYSNLSLDSNGATTITAPTTLGYYALDCTVTGVPYYTFGDTGFSSPQYLVSEQQPLGGVKLYTRPTTVVAGTPIQMYIVFNAGPGLPTPTGQFTVYIGQGSNFYYTQSLKIGANGTASISLAAISNLYSANVITVTYWGDPYYKTVSVNFPMTNPAIPGSAGGSAGGTTPGQASATTTPGAKATASATGTASATTGGANTGGAAGNGASTGGATSSGATPSVFSSFTPLAGGGLVALLIAIGLLVVGSGVGTFVLLSRRGAARASGDARFGAAPWTPPAPPSGSSFDEETLPQRRIDREWPPRQ